MNYSWQYGSNYSASPELQTMCNGWYENGTEVIFACGGSMFQSVAAAASANDGYVVGVDTDQSGDSDTVITSAMKGIGEAAQYAIGKVYDNTWDEIGGLTTTLGAADDAKLACPPMRAPGDWRPTRWRNTRAELESIKTGENRVDANYDNLQQDYSNLTLNII